MRLLGMVALLAACSEPPGLTLEVIVEDPAVKTLELFVGGPCEGCPSSWTPPSNPQMRSKSADPFAIIDTQRWSAEVENGVAYFRLRGADAEQLVPIVVVVGYDDAGLPSATYTQRDVTVPYGKTEYWQIHLTDATPLVDTTTPAPDGTERVVAWRAPASSLPSCVMVEHWSANQAQREVLVPQSDPDCDGVLEAQECAAFVPNAMGIPATISNASCFTSALGAYGDLCLLGGEACYERDANPMGGCERLDRDYCASPLFCAACGDGTAGSACIKTTIGNALGEMAHLECFLPVNATGGSCDHPAQALVVTEMFDNLTNMPASCRAVRIRSVEQLGAFGSSVTVGGATVKIADFRTPCTVDIELSGTVDLVTGQGQIEMLADLDFDNGKHMVVPFVIHALRDSCSNTQVVCAGKPAPQDSAYACAGASPPMQSETCSPPAGSLFCPGAECNGTCCGVGETCSGGICRCGSGPHCTADAVCAGPFHPSHPDCGSTCLRVLP